MGEGQEHLGHGGVATVPTGDVVGPLEIGPHRQQHVRRDLQHQHAALRVDPDEDGDDEVLVPTADPDAQEVPAPLAALLDRGGAVLGEGLRGQVHRVHVGHSGGRQEHALVDDQFAQPVQYGVVRRLGPARRGGAQGLQPGPDLLDDPLVVEAPGSRPGARAQLHGELPRQMGLAGAAERIADVVQDQRRVLGALDVLPGPLEAPSRRGVAGAVLVPCPAERGADDLREVPALQADEHRDQHGDQDDRPRVGLSVDLPDPRDLREDRQRVGLQELGQVRAEVAQVQVRPVARVVREEPAEHPPQDAAEEEAGAAAQDPFEDPAATAAALAALLDPPGPAQEQRRDEQEEEERTGEEQAEAPHRHDRRRPGHFGAQGPQGVGEDAGCVEPVRGGGEPFLVDVQLLDHPVAVGGVEVGAGTQEASRLRYRRVHGGPAVRCAAHEFPSVGRRETVRGAGRAGQGGSRQKAPARAPGPFQAYRIGPAG